MQQLILASTSVFRKQLLMRLGLKFETLNPQIDETPLPGESAADMVRRLAQAKAQAVVKMKDCAQALIIGSDQAALADGAILGKPGQHAQAVEQLRRLSGRSAEFLTAVCLYNHATQRAQIEIVPTTVVFRTLSDAQIEHYLKREPAYQCAGSFKSEGLGISLVEKITGDDPTALIGLPLIRLTSMLENEGVRVL
ncbi:MAG: Maf family nucleotide pyrophosphatase [Pseudomonadota bacterium]